MLSYKMEGIYKSNNNNLPFKDAPTILFRGKEGEIFCRGCADELVGNKLIVIEDMFIHWSGDPLVCNWCGSTLESEEDK